MTWHTVRVPLGYDLLAPDGSEIRLLVQLRGGSMVHCRLPRGQVTQAVRHQTVEELWYCVAGAGQLWRQFEDRGEIVDLEPGVAISIPTGVGFQFRARAASALEVLITTMPPWPGPAEAVPVDGPWMPSPPADPATRPTPAG